MDKKDVARSNWRDTEWKFWEIIILFKSEEESYYQDNGARIEEGLGKWRCLVKGTLKIC